MTAAQIDLIFRVFYARVFVAKSAEDEAGCQAFVSAGYVRRETQGEPKGYAIARAGVVFVHRYMRRGA